MLKLDWEMQKRDLAAMWRGKNMTGWYWTWGDFGIPWGAPGMYWMWGIGFFTVVVYDGELWSIQPNID
jgi:hypothetical protein